MKFRLSTSSMMSWRMKRRCTNSTEKATWFISCFNLEEDVHLTHLTDEECLLTWTTFTVLDSWVEYKPTKAGDLCMGKSAALVKANIQFVQRRCIPQSTLEIHMTHKFEDCLKRSGFAAQSGTSQFWLLLYCKRRRIMFDVQVQDLIMKWSASLTALQ